MKSISIICVVICATALIGCSGVTKIKPTTIVTKAEFEADIKQLATKAMKNGIVIKLSKGDTISLHMETDLPFAKLVPGNNEIAVTRDVYFYFSSKGVMLSPDGVLFASLLQPKAIKKLFGAKRGQLQLGFKATEPDGSAVTLKLSLQ